MTGANVAHRVVGGRSSVQEGFCKNLVMEGRPAPIMWLNLSLATRSIALKLAATTANGATGHTGVVVPSVEVRGFATGT